MSKHSLRMRFVALSMMGVSAIALSGVSVAADKGLYLEGRVGAVVAEESEFETTAEVEADRDLGWLAGIALGYAYGNGLRGEFGYDYRQNNVDTVGGVSGGGKMRASSLMVSGFYDFFRDSSVQPYVGGGLGGAFVDADNVNPVGGSIVNDDDISFAYQAMAGVAVNVSPRVKVTLGYRYFAVPDLDFKTAAGASADADYSNHEILLGVRFTFGAPQAKPEPEPMPAAAPAPEPAPPPAPMAAPEPAPAPAPPPEPEISRNFIVFFDWNRSDITSLADNIIRSAVNEANRVGNVRIRLTGHADRSGNARYNQGLSMRRANAVSGRLQQLGIAANEISVFAKGESEPLVTTADGVREPQNRRVEIVLE